MTRRTNAFEERDFEMQVEALQVVRDWMRENPNATHSQIGERIDNGINGCKGFITKINKRGAS